MTSKRTWDWVDGIAHRLIHRAARRVPDSLSERLKEEWLADFEVQRGAMARLRFALGCCWATNVIAHEHAVAAIAATSSAAGHGQLIRHPGEDFPFFSGRTITFVLATVSVCVDGRGRLVSEPTLVESTGSTRLDDAALRLAKAGSGHYRATTEDGQTVNSCYPFRIRFELRN